jgi:hypothetical protein
MVSSLSRRHDHTQTLHTRYDSSGWVISPSHRPLAENTRHSQERDSHALIPKKPAGMVSSLSRRHDHTQTLHNRYDSSGWVISPSHRPLADNTRQSQETDSHARISKKPAGMVSSLSRRHNHTQTHHNRYDSSGWVISPSHRLLADKTRHSQQTDSHASNGIWTHNEMWTIHKNNSYNILT